jgi:hypothetical protein
MQSEATCYPSHQRKTLISNEYCDPFQVDFIDMRRKKKNIIYGAFQCKILTVKDHSNGLTDVISLPHICLILSLVQLAI